LIEFKLTVSLVLSARFTYSIYRIVLHREVFVCMTKRSADLAEYYSDNEHDFICSPLDTEGMTKCSGLPPYSEHLLRWGVASNTTKLLRPR